MLTRACALAVTVTALFGAACDAPTRGDGADGEAATSSSAAAVAGATDAPATFSQLAARVGDLPFRVELEIDAPAYGNPTFVIARDGSLMSLTFGDVSLHAHPAGIVVCNGDGYPNRCMVLDAGPDDLTIRTTLDGTRAWWAIAGLQDPDALEDGPSREIDGRRAQCGTVTHGWELGVSTASVCLDAATAAPVLIAWPDGEKGEFTATATKLGEPTDDELVAPRPIKSLSDAERDDHGDVAADDPALTGRA